MFGALIIPAAIGGIVGGTKQIHQAWPGATAMKGAMLGAGLGVAYSVLRSKTGISGNIDMQRKYFGKQQGLNQAVYQRSISAGGIFDSIRLI